MSSPDYHSESRSGINPFHSAHGHGFLQRNKPRCILRYELSGLASEGTINDRASVSEQTASWNYHLRH